MAENWYIILELEFDPNPEENISVINQRIDEKAKFWSSKFNDFNKGPQYRKYHQMIPEIKRIMADDIERKKQIKEACDLTYGPIDKILKTIGRKGEVTEDEVGKLSAKQKVTDEIVKRRALELGIKVVSSQETDFQTFYDKYYKAKPQNAATYDGMKQLLKSFNVDNLYDFLYVGTNVKSANRLPCDVLRQRALERKKKEFYKNDSISGSGSKLCGQCDLTFKDDSTKNAYDKYIEYNKRKIVLDEVKEIFDISGELSIDEANSFIDQLTELFKDKKLSEEVLTAFCKVEKIPIPVFGLESRVSAKPQNIKICRCGCINDISDGRKICQNCGLELVIRCPKCGTENDANINVCKCGFKFENIDRASALCELAENSMDAMEFQIAKANLEDAEKYWPGSSRVKVLKERLAELEKRIGNTGEAFRKACIEKEYYEAKKQYANIKKFFHDFDEHELESEMNTAISQAQSFLEQAQSSDLEQIIIDYCTKAFEVCKDLPGIKETIAKYPPQMPSNLQVVVDNNTRKNIINWEASKSSGLIYYTVVKKVGVIPVSTNDGEIIGRVSMCSITDSNIAAGEYYYYAVFAERVGIYSKAAVNSKPSVNLFEVSNVIVTAGDGLLQFNWDKVPQNASIQVFRKTDSGNEEALKCNNNQSFIDRELINDKEYTYRICLLYRIDGVEETTEGIILSGIPTKPPKPIEVINVKAVEGDTFQIAWENPEKSDVQFFYSTERPEFKLGDLLTQNLLESKMQNLVIVKSGQSCGTFQYKSTESIYVTVAVIKSGSAVFGALARVSKEEMLIIKNVAIVNGKISISIDLPQNTTGFVVLYRFDKYPTDISDIKTTRKYIPLKQYQHDNALVIDSQEQKNYYFSIFAEFIRYNEKYYSSGTEYLFENAKKEVITYSIKVSKKLFGSSNVILEFEAESHNFILPDIYIVSAVGITPMFKESAKLFYSISSQEVSGSVQIKIPIPKEIERDTYIKAFIKDDSLQKTYQLKLKLKSNYQIS